MQPNGSTLRHRTAIDTSVRLMVSSAVVDAILDYLAPPAQGLSMASVAPCQATLAVSDGQLMLAFRLQDGERLQRMPLLLPIEPQWHGPLLWAFEPVFGSVRQMTIRPCLVRLEWSASGLMLDLVPRDGRRTTVVLPAGMSLDWLHIPVAPVAAALMVAIAPGLPVAAADYVVKPGDTLYGISRTYLGGGQHWRKVTLTNGRPVRDPRRLMPGTRLHVPDGVQHRTTSRTIIVKRGDTLYGLAQRHLGDGAKWRQLWQSARHHIARPEQLPVGFVLQLPAGQTAVTAVRPAPQAVRPTKPLPPAHPSPAAVRPSPSVAPTSAPVEPSQAPVTVASSPSVTPDSPAPSPTPSPAIEPEVTPSVPVGGMEPAPVPSGAELAPSDSDAAAVPATLPGDVEQGSPSDLAAVASPAPEAVADPSPIPAEPASADTIERPFASHIGLSYTPTNMTEGLTTQSLTGQATVLRSFGAQAAWRALPALELSGTYQVGHYLVDRGTFGQGMRTEQHGRAMGAYVWPLLPNLELAAGLGVQGGFYGAADMAITGRPADYFDGGYQRLMVEAEAKVGYRPIAQLPLTLTAGLSALPYGATLNAPAGLPNQLWGLGWQAGARYTVNGFALETGYRGQRVWGSSFQQSSDLLHGTVGYYFQ
jgi:LysM repeat protein